MDLLREIGFILWHARSLAHRYKTQSIWAALTLLLSLASRLARNNFFASESTTKQILGWASDISFALTILIFLLAFIDLIRHRLPLSDLVFTVASSDAYYHDPSENRYELVERMHCVNRTDNPIRRFITMRDGFWEELSNWKLEYHLDSKPALSLSNMALTHGVEPSSVPGVPDLHLYSRETHFQPSIAKGQEVDVIYRASAQAVAPPVEAAAFSVSGRGAFFRGVDYHSLLYYITIHAPQGYEVHLLDWGVIDANGKEKSEETQRQKEPKVSAAKNQIVWRVTLAQKDLRYLLRYKFEACPWTLLT